MKIFLKKLSLENFKGIKSLEINFSENTTISGANGTGKTTIFDAFLWCLFGKDSADRKDFNVKTIEYNGMATEKINHSVTAILSIDGMETTLTRTLRENWVKRRGELESTLSGNETLYFVNEVPHQAGEYQKKVSGICNEGLFKLITSPTYFNEILKWDQRREMLIQMAGDVTDDQIGKQKKEFSDILKSLIGKDLKGYKAEVSAKRKKLKEEIESIPTRIDECHKAMPEAKDWDEIKRSIAFKDSEVKDIEDKLSGSVIITEAHNKEQAGIRADIEKKRRALQNIEFSLQSADQSAIREYSEKKRQLEASLQSCKSDILRFSNEANGIAETKKRYEARVNELRAEWNSENEKELVFDQSKFECPTCKRPFEADDIEAKKAEMAESFNASKLSALNAINASGVSIKAEIKKCEDQLAALAQPAKDAQTRLENITNALSELKEPVTKSLADLIASSPEHKQLSGEIAALSDCLTETTPVSNESLKSQKSELLAEIDTLKIQLSDKTRINDLKKRITELERQHREFAGQLADLEGIENTIFEFEKAKIEAVEDRINAMFSTVKFRMFRQLINKTSEPCCEATVNGVPYPDVNNAGNINAGLDIINAISKANDVYAPIFIDNSESIVSLLPMNTQLIRLVVTTEPKLTISNN